MKISCDVCKTAAAAMICCADEAALCAKCDVEVHAANKLAGKHRRLPLNCDSSKLPRCDICQDKAAFIFCVEDRALLCQGCDEAIHIAGTLSGNHQRLLATGIRVGLSSTETVGSNNHHSEPPNCHSMAQKQPPSALSPSLWAVDDLLQLSDYESAYKREISVGLGELSWLALAQVPEMLEDDDFYRAAKSGMPYKKPRIGMLEDDDFFTVPDLG